MVKHMCRISSPRTDLAKNLVLYVKRHKEFSMLYEESVRILLKLMIKYAGMTLQDFDQVKGDTRIVEQIRKIAMELV